MCNAKNYLLLFLILFSFLSCRKEPPVPVIKINGIVLKINYKVDNDDLIRNVNKYINQAGNHFSLNTLDYYLSQISLLKADGSTVLVKDVQYIDATNNTSNQFTYTTIPAGNYVGIKFNIGLDSLHNKTDVLPTTVENINMIWPDMMGGGYHFMKLEGYFLDSSSNSFGYAMHLGTNAVLVPVKLMKNISISPDAKTELNLIMNINEWFRNPNTYDFNKDGNYIMGNAVLMKKIADNGVDVFSF